MDSKKIPRPEDSGGGAKQTHGDHFAPLSLVMTECPFLLGK